MTKVNGPKINKIMSMILYTSKVNNGPLTLTPHLKKWVPHHSINVPAPETPAI